MNIGNISLDTFKSCNWYDWAIEYWGCKWDIYPDVFEINDDENKITFSFLSAWSDPVNFFEWLKDHGVDFYRSFDEPGEMWVGRQIVKDGVELENSCETGDDYYIWRAAEWSHLYSIEDQLDLEGYKSLEDFKENHYYTPKTDTLLDLIKEYYQGKENQQSEN